MIRCIPIRDLKDTAEISRMCHNSHEPIFITKNGRQEMVIMSSEVYEKTRLFSVYERLMEAEADIATGNVTDAKTSLQKLRVKHGL